MKGAKSADSLITTKAYTNAYQRIISTGRMGSQYSYYDDHKVYSRIQLTPSRSRDIVCGRFCFNGTTTNGDELEYFIRIYPFGNYNALLSESEWVSANTWVQGFNVTSSAGASNPDETLELWVRRKDGGILTPSSLDYTLVSWDCTMMENVAETTAIPSNWLETTTQTNLFIPLVTVTTPIETYQGSHGGGGGERGVVYDLNYYLEIPQEVAGVVSYIFYLFGQIASLKYVTTLICLAMVLGTLRFIMR